MDQKDLEKLNNPEMIAKFDQTINNLIITDSVGEARELALILAGIFARHPEFKKINPSLFNIYYNYLVAIKYIILFDLEAGEITQLIRDEFDFVLDHPEYDLWRKIKYKIRDINGLEERDIFKEKIRRALLECKIPFSRGKIIINDLSQEATVANWLKDYYTKVGIERADPLKLNEYLVNNSNVKLLSVEEKTKLKNLLNFFENIKVSSQEVPMFEESVAAILPNEEIAAVTEGRLEKISGEILKMAREVSVIGGEELRPVPSVASAVSSDDDLFLKSASSVKPVAQPVIQPKPSSALTFSISDLEQVLKNYSSSSLEYKVIKEEINRLNKLEAKKSEKSDAKK